MMILIVCLGGAKLYVLAHSFLAAVVPVCNQNALGIAGLSTMHKCGKSLIFGKITVSHTHFLRILENIKYFIFELNMNIKHAMFN